MNGNGYKAGIYLVIGAVLAVIVVLAILYVTSGGR